MPLIDLLTWLQVTSDWLGWGDKFFLLLKPLWPSGFGVFSWKPCCGFVPSIQVVAFRQSLSPDRFGFLLNNDWVAALSVALQSIKGDRWLVIASHLWLSTICSQTGFAPSSPIFSGRISDEVWSCKKRSWRHSAKPVYIAILFVRLAEVLMSNEERGDSCQRLNLKDFPACLMPMWGEGLPIRTCSALHNLT